MSTTEPIPLLQRNWAKTLAWLVPIAAFCLVVYRFIAEPTTEITASYHVSALELPDYLKRTTKADTIIIGKTTFIRRLNEAYLDKLTFKEQLNVPDSLNPFKDKYAYSSDSYPQFQRFAMDHKGFATLSIKNEGKKLVKQVQILHESPAYYEYKDSGGHLQAGRSETKFLVGDLSPTEKREVSMWFTSRYGLGKQGIVVTYDDGRVIAEQPVEVTGTTAWLIDNSFTVVYTLIILICVTGPYLLARASYRRRLEIEAAREEGRLDVKNDLQAAQAQADEVSREFNKMLSSNKYPPAP